MSTIRGLRAVKRDHRLFEPLGNMLVLQSAMVTSTEVITGYYPMGKPRGKGHIYMVQSEIADMRFYFPFYGYLENAIAGKPLEEIGISIVRGNTPKNRVTDMARFPGYMEQLHAAIFVLHFEACRMWLEDNGLNDTSVWPMVLDFARTVRNACAHGGRLRIKKTKRGNIYRPVTWHGLTYEYADGEKQVLGTELYGGDLVALMFDVDDELVALGAPN